MSDQNLDGASYALRELLDCVCGYEFSLEMGDFELEEKREKLSIINALTDHIDQIEDLIGHLRHLGESE